jgi:hypothetical protein
MKNNTKDNALIECTKHNPEAAGFAQDSHKIMKREISRMCSLVRKGRRNPFTLKDFISLVCMLEHIITFVHAEVDAMQANPQSIDRARVEFLLRITKKSAIEILPGMTYQFLLMLDWLRTLRRSTSLDTSSTHSMVEASRDQDRVLPRHTSSRRNGETNQ